MKSISEEIIALERDEWDYYHDREINKAVNNLTVPFVHNDAQEHYNFIEEYFKIGGKGDVYNSFKIDRKTFDRPEHTNSVFFIGCLFYKHLNLKGQMNIKQFGKGDHFFFVWYMMVLAHDLSYIYESNFSHYKNHISDNIDDFKKELQIEEDDLLKLIESVIKEADNNMAILIKSVSSYYRYCYNERDRIDHGITAGLKLYSTLEKNRKKKNEGDEHDKGGLYWGTELIELYMMASLGILLHNIWAPDKNSIELYRKHEMEDLVKVFPVSFNDFPFLFLLGIVDTIDPVKLYKEYSPKYVLENILISFEDENKIVLEKVEDSNLDFSLLEKAAFGLIGWLDVLVCKDVNSVTITIEGI